MRIARARYAVELPCRFQLVAAANPCPCGRGAESGECRCDPAAVRGYEAKLTGALADRIDISVQVEQPDLIEFSEPGEGSASVRERVLAARERQHAAGSDRTRTWRPRRIPVGDEVERTLADAGAAAGLSGRGRERVVRVARTLADLDAAEEIAVDHLLEAMAMRRRGEARRRMRSAATWTLRAGEAGYPRVARRPGRPRAAARVRAPGGAGAVTALDHDAVVTIVGSRRASAYGLRVAERLGRELATAGVAVVSGLALGIDAAAHRGALAGGGTTIAVLAGGPDVVYPRSHGDLYGRVVERGAAISEHPPGTGPRKVFFVARNRLMAALGKVVVIVEAAQPSGSLVTADEAAKLGRTVGAVPGSVEARVAAGTNALLADGAHVIRDGRDVLDLLFGVGAVAPGIAAGADRAAARPGPPLDPALREVARPGRDRRRTVDGVAVAAGVAAREAALALTRLELLGYVSGERRSAASSAEPAARRG